MTPTELFVKACDAWGVEISEVFADPKDFMPRRTLSYKGKVLDVNWKPEVAQDMAAFHGHDAEVTLVMFFLDSVANRVLEHDYQANNDSVDNSPKTP